MVSVTPQREGFKKVGEGKSTPCRPTKRRKIGKTASQRQGQMSRASL